MPYSDIEINKKVKEEAIFFEKIKKEVGKVIVGHGHMIDRLLMALLTNEHILIEGVPGLAKTLTIKTLADVMHLQFSRIQFTPDLLPSDLIGVIIYDHKQGEFIPKKGPVFANIVLADEINRSPAKVQSALLQAMQERQVTLGDFTYPLDEPFMILATQNPIELEGTYALPEAQLDRFMFKIRIDYPTIEEEKEIMERMSISSTAYNPFKICVASDILQGVEKVATKDEIARARSILDTIYMDDSVKDYIVRLVRATRNGADFGLKGMIEYGSSPRGSIFLNKASKANAFLQGRGYVLPDDVKAVVPDVLRHRLILSYEAEAKAVTADDVVKEILSKVKVP
ncbi:MAG: MoxR family ATPase [Deltaproteobacteria bacterium]|nr:MoxR family ATPase [Deltaproteobacteria bacterium]